MKDDRLPKIILFGQPSRAQQLAGCPRMGACPFSTSLILCWWKLKIPFYLLSTSLKGNPLDLDCFLAELTHALKVASSVSVPSVRVKIGTEKQGRKEDDELQDTKHCHKFWFWADCDRPRSGVNFSIVKSTKCEFQKALRRRENRQVQTVTRRAQQLAGCPRMGACPFSTSLILCWWKLKIPFYLLSTSLKGNPLDLDCFLAELTHALKVASSASVPSVRVKIGTEKQGRKEDDELQDTKHRHKFWFWADCDRPRSGANFSIVKSTKREFQRALRRRENRQVQTATRDIKNNPQQLWRRVFKMAPSSSS